MPSSRGCSRPSVRTGAFCIAGRFFAAEPLGQPKYVCVCIYIYIKLLIPNSQSIPPNRPPPWQSQICSMSLFLCGRFVLYFRSMFK